MLLLMSSSSAPCTWLAVTCLCPAVGHQAVGAWCCWRIPSTTSGLAFVLLSASPELLFDKGWIWIPPQCSGCWLVLLGAAGHALQSHPYLPFMSAWLQIGDLWLHWMLLTIAVAGCCGGSLKPACSWARSVLPGALPQLLHDKALLELSYVIVVVVLVWKCFGMHSLKARECLLEGIITCWCSSWKCALWPQQIYCNQKCCFGQLTLSLSFKEEKNCTALQWSILPSEISSRFKSVETQGVLRSRGGQQLALTPVVFSGCSCCRDVLCTA